MDRESTPKNKPHVRPKQRSGARTPPAAQPPYYEDEISLLDLWLVLVRRKNVLGMVFLLFVAAGVTAALLLPEKYRYTSVMEIGARNTSVMEIGTRILDERAQPIEDTATVLVKVTETYVPLAQGEYINAHGDEATICQVSAKIPTSSHMLIMESTVTQQGADSCITIQRSVMEFIVDDHKRISDVLRKELELQLTKAKSGLDARKGQYKRFTALLDKQIVQTKGFVAGAMRNGEKVVNEATDEARAMTLFMLADNLRAQANEQGTVNKIKTQILNIKETAVMMPPTRSLERISPKRRFIVSLAAVMGLIAGIFSAFFAEFVAKARAQVKP